MRYGKYKSSEDEEDDDEIVFEEESAPGLFESLYDKRIIILDKEVNERSTSELIAKIILLNLTSTKPITLLINSTGGDMYSAFGLIDVLRDSKAPIFTVCIGLAASAAALILSAGHKRYALPSTQIMVHCHWQAYNDTSALTHHELMIEAKQSEYMFALNRKYYENVTGLSSDDVKQMLDRDTYISPTEAKNLKLIDEIGWNIYANV